jgi:hypothetical protein
MIHVTATCDLALELLWLFSVDRPLVVQFAAKDPVHFGLAAQKVSKFVIFIISIHWLFTDVTVMCHERSISFYSIFRYADAVDLNCGCPQKWAMSEGLGASMIKNPQLVSPMEHDWRRLLQLCWEFTVCAP